MNRVMNRASRSPELTSTLIEAAAQRMSRDRIDESQHGPVRVLVQNGVRVDDLPTLITSHRYTEHPSVQSPDCAICGLPVGDHASAVIGGGR